MVKWTESKRFGRRIRGDDWSEIGKPTWPLAEQAIREGRIDEALELVDLARFENNFPRMGFHSIMMKTQNFIADNWGEEQIEKLWRFLGKDSVVHSTLVGEQAVAEQIQTMCTVHRGLHSGPGDGLHLAPGQCGGFTVVEEADRYVLTLEPCGTGGRFAKMGVLNATKKAYPWSWGKAGIPYNCCHCCLWWEIMPIEEYGHPIRIFEPDGLPDRCVSFFYKSPDLIPEKYYTRLGLKRDRSRASRK